MTKAELVEDVARAAELTKKDAERLVEIVFESIIETLNQGEKIELRGFGSFRTAARDTAAAGSETRGGVARTPHTLSAMHRRHMLQASALRPRARRRWRTTR